MSTIMTNAPLKEILDKEIEERYPSISYTTLVPSEWYTREDRAFTQQEAKAFWEQRLCFLLLLQEVLA